MRRLATSLAATAVTAAATIALAAPAQAVPADKQQVLASWTQTSASSYNTWLAARNNQGAWASYQFDWSTDYCSSSPDNPFGFPFQTACARHDFGYRNHKAMGIFDANKARIDSAFYEDLKRVCNAYSGATKTSCNGTAWTYYQAVKVFG
ncbi:MULTISPECIES: phospholipase [Streptomyces violaceusniger group]|uniref:Phospholipase n=2 Tax=Streptomyces rhizosphaericus TaxID=114699 RepID=A0ABP4ACU1_9ACTN|nr:MULTISPECIES: phospholipase [Streptomyces violaceusniger group]